MRSPSLTKGRKRTRPDNASHTETNFLRQRRSAVGALVADHMADGLASSFDTATLEVKLLPAEIEDAGASVAKELAYLKDKQKKAKVEAL